MRTKKADFLLPGHGPHIVGASRVHEALTETAKFLDVIIKQALDGMNKVFFFGFHTQEKNKQ